MRIAVVGAPGSGKSTFSARLYAELLERGVVSARLVTEYAQEWLGQGNQIDFSGQKTITKNQIDRENYTENCGFSPIICDSGIWLGSIYREYWLENNSIGLGWPRTDIEYIHKTMEYIKNYEITIYVPLFKKDDQINEFRIHDGLESKEIDKKILEKLDGRRIQYQKVPRKIADREHFVKIVASEIIDIMQEQHEKINLL